MAGEKDNLQENENNAPQEKKASQSVQKYPGFGEMIGAVVIQPGQTEAESIEQMKAMVADKVGDEQLILDGIRTVKPDYAITAEDEAQRLERRQLSQQARDNMFKFFHRKGGLVYDLNAKSEGNAAENAKPKKVSIVRGIDMLYDYRPGKEAEEHNKYVQSLFAVDANGRCINGTPEARTAVMLTFIDKVLNTDFDKFYHMSDQEVAENFLDSYGLFILCVEGADSLKKLDDGKTFSLPEEYREKLTALKTQHQGIFTTLKARLDAIADASYEIFHYERLHRKPGEDSWDCADNINRPTEDEFKEPDEFEKAKEDYAVALRVNKSKDALTFFNKMQSLTLLNFSGGVDKVNQHIRKLNIPEDQLRMPYRNRNNDLIVPTLLDVTDIKGKKVSDFDLLNGDLLMFTDPVTKEKHFLKPNGKNLEEIDVTRWPAPLNEQPAKLAKMLDDADPWYIRVFTGSDKFKDMKKAARHVQELRNKLTENPDAKQQEELSKALEDLEKKTNEYIEYKGDVTRHTKESERARINAAKAIQEFAKEGRALVKGYENNLEIARAARKKHEQAKEKREDDIWDHYEVEPSDSMSKLSSWIKDNLEMAGEALPEDPMKLMAMMVTFDLVMRERKAKGEGEPHPIEEKFLQGPDEFLKGLRESETLQQMAAGMDAEGFQKFVDEAIGVRGLQKMSTTVLQEAVQKQQEALRKEQEALQKQQEALQKEQPAPQVQQTAVQQTAPEVKTKSGMG